MWCRTQRVRHKVYYLMKKYTVGILAHVDSGKTTFIESLLYETGVISSCGRVDHQNTFLDTDSLERERGITIYSKNARIPIAGCDTQLILIDTPGHVDFGPEMERSLCVLDYAILIISAPEGIKAHTKTLFSLLAGMRIPTFIFVNKMDMPGAESGFILEKIRGSLTGDAVDFSKIALSFSTEAGGINSGKSDMSEFYENVATADEKLLDEFLETERISDNHIAAAIANRKIFPVMFGSALKNEGVKEFLNTFSHFLRTDSFDDEYPDKVGEKDSSEDEKAFSGIVYKISNDAKGQRLTFVKVFSGSLKVKSILDDEKINEIRLYSGEKYESVSEVFAGDICALVGLKNKKIGDSFGKVFRSVIASLSPALCYAVRYPKDRDRNEVRSILEIMCDEDPSLNVTFSEDTGEILVYLMGDVQAEILKNSLKERFSLDAEFTDGKVLYRETIDSAFEGVGHFEPLRHYAEAHISLEPNERGMGMTFSAAVPEEELARNWQRLIYTHMTEKNHKGVLIGAPITDINMRLVSGRAHLKHTEGGDFRQATYRAIRQGLMELRALGHCRLLEPFYDYTLEIPTELVGRAMTDINGMCGTCEITESDAALGISVLCGRVPVSTMNGYSKEVVAYTKGQGKLYMNLSGYDTCHNEEEVLAASTYDPDADLRNPASSVFCSHGAGTVVPWDEVPEYMHIEYATGEEKSHTEALDEAARLNKRRRELDVKSTLDLAMGTEEIDSILRASSHANENGRKGGYKGISENMKERNRRTESSGNSKYVGKKTKEQFMLVDAYNVIYAWPELRRQLDISPDAAAGMLNDILCNYQAMTGITLMVVYDAYRIKGRIAQAQEYDNITVVYTAADQTADRYIERYLNENRGKYDFSVVTSDALEQVISSAKGACIVSSREFEIMVNNTTREFNEKFDVT